MDVNSIDLEPGDIAPGEAGGVGHFSGYVSRSACRNLHCEDYKAAIVMNKELPRVPVDGGEYVRSVLLEMFHAMTELQDRGGLLYTSDECIYFVMVGLEVFKAIVKPAKLWAKLMAVHSAEGVLICLHLL